MKLDKQRRLTIPYFFIERLKMNAKKYYFCDDNGKLYLVPEVTRNDKILAQVTMDIKNRIIIPVYLKCYIDSSKEVIVYEKDKKLWIENYKKVAE